MLSYRTLNVADAIAQRISSDSFEEAEGLAQTLDDGGVGDPTRQWPRSVKDIWATNAARSSVLMQVKYSGHRSLVRDYLD